MVSLIVTLGGTASAFPELVYMSSLREVPTKFYTNSVLFAKRKFPGRTHSQQTRLKYQNNSDLLEMEPSEEQAKVDDYLEFLNRRYHRLHDENPEEVKFSVWEWLLQKSDATTTETEAEADVVTVSREQKDDAFFALGVAGLASDRLLQKYASSSKVDSTSLREAAKTSDRIIDVETTVVPPSAMGRSMASTVPGSLALSLRYLALKRRKLISYGPMTLLRSVLTSMMRLLKTPRVQEGLVEAPRKSAKRLLELGGGRKNVTLSVTLTFAFLCLLRPLAQAVLSEGLALKQG